MELAINSFNKGLLMDTHPLVLGNDTLSDCLNGTFITMNGNEVILLNDMGNRRVDHAYLPSGYEPVGIKEYGGIIYVASYNPVTGRSLIGSFPSPERIISGNEYENLGGEIKLPESFSVDESSWLKNDIILILLTNDTSLHVGDKFAVYSNYIWELGKYITNFNQNNDRDKNRYYTLSLGIINSQNEFVDITKSLERYDKNGDIIKEFDSDKDKFNTGYFIAPEGNKINNGIEDRDKIAANTYSYKLVGPLYLKAELNHIKTFSYTINSSKEKNGNSYTVTVIITGTAIYNCPGDFDKENKEIGIDSFEFVVPEIDNINRLSLKSTEYNSFSKNSDGTYTSVITKKYTITGCSNENTINYEIKVPIKAPIYNIEREVYEEKTYAYLLDLSSKGILDVSKIGTNECKLIGWRFKNIVKDNKVLLTSLSFLFETYSDLNTKFDNLSIKVINNPEEPTNSIELIGTYIPLNTSTPISSGTYTYIINWEDENIYRKLYEVKISWNKNGVEQDSVSRFILGTKLFNNCYNLGNLDYVRDFGYFMDPNNKAENSIYNKYVGFDVENIGEVKILEELVSHKSDNDKMIINKEEYLSLGDPKIFRYEDVSKKTLSIDKSKLKGQIHDLNNYPSFLDNYSDSLNINVSNETWELEDTPDKSIFEYTTDNSNNLDTIKLVTIEDGNLIYKNILESEAVTSADYMTIYTDLNGEIFKKKIFPTGFKLQDLPNYGWSVRWWSTEELHHVYIALFAHLYEYYDTFENDWEDRNFPINSNQIGWDSLPNFAEVHRRLCEAAYSLKNLSIVHYFMGTELGLGDYSYFYEFKKDSGEYRQVGEERIYPAAGGPNYGKPDYSYLWLLNKDNPTTMTILEYVNEKGEVITVFPRNAKKQNGEWIDIEQEVLDFLGTTYDGNSKYIVRIGDFNIKDLLYYPSSDSYIYNNEYQFNVKYSADIETNTTEDIPKSIIEFFRKEDTSSKITSYKTFRSSNKFNDIIQGIFDKSIFNKVIYINTAEEVDEKDMLLKYNNNTKKIEKVPDTLPFTVLSDLTIRSLKNTPEDFPNGIMFSCTPPNDRFLTGLIFSGYVPVIHKYELT